MALVEDSNWLWVDYRLRGRGGGIDAPRPVSPRPSPGGLLPSLPVAVAVAVAVAAAVAVATGRPWPRLLWWSPGTGASTPQKTLGNVLGAARSLSGYRLLSSVRS